MEMIGRGPQRCDDNVTADDNEALFHKALTSLACFVTPQCFPRYKCKHGDPQMIKRRKKWEEMAFCTGDLQIRQEELSKAASTDGSNGRSGGDNYGTGVNKCLVYSFGVHNEMEWEEKVGLLFGCEVHAFDPTVDHPNTSYVTFHKLGLQGDGPVKTTNAIQYGTIDPTLLLSLPDIMHRLGHVGRKVDVLMLDCEGCEWGVLHQLFCHDNGGGDLIGQVLLEAHFQKKLGLETDADVVMAGNAIDCLWRDGWGAVTQEDASFNRRGADYTRGVLEVLPTDSFLMYVALQRLSPEDGSDQKARVPGEKKPVTFDKRYRHFEEK